MAPSELTLVSAAVAGDVRAYGRLVEKFQSLACAVAFGATGDHGLAEELAQEAFVTAWNRLPELRDLSRFRPWLCGIVRNHTRTARRHLSRHAPDALRRADPRESGQSGESIDIACPTATPLDTVIAGQERRLVSDALDGLAEPYREPIVLFYGERLPLRDIAELLGISEETARQRLARGRKKLREQLAQLCRGPARAGMSAAVLAVIAIPATARAAVRPGAGAVAALGAAALAMATAVFLLAVTALGTDPVGARSQRGSLAIDVAPITPPAPPAQSPDPARSPDPIAKAPALRAAVAAPVGVVEIGRGRVGPEPTRAISATSVDTVRVPRSTAGGAARTRVTHGPAVVSSRPLLRPELTIDDIR